VSLNVTASCSSKRASSPEKGGAVSGEGREKTAAVYERSRRRLREKEDGGVAPSTWGLIIEKEKFINL
jgi:hypothetical protein